MNKIQELQLQLIELSSFNNFDGEAVSKDLKDNKELWRGAIMGRFGGYAVLLPLRDIENGCWNVDTLMITPVKGKEMELIQLAHTWGADEVDWIGGEDACKMFGSYSTEQQANPYQVLRLWWD